MGVSETPVPTKINWNELENRLVQLPYIKVVPITWCDGWVKANNRNRKCDKRAAFHFRKSNAMAAKKKSGYFCLYHLYMTVRSSKFEEHRAEIAYAKIERDRS